MKKSLRGQAAISKVVIWIIGIMLVAIAFYGILGASKGSPLSDAIDDGANEVAKIFTSIFKPLFGGLLGLDRAGLEGGNDFLMILVFILILIVITGILDTTGMFGDVNYGKWANFGIGLIVSVIGVRFMPVDLWGSLTAPSSAFVATILVGAPFLCLAFLTIKMKSVFVGKLLWLFYMVFMSYLIFWGTSASGSFKLIYIAFLILAGLMLVFDSTARHFFYRERGKLEVAREVGKLNLVARKKLRDEIRQWQEIIVDTGASPEDRGKAKRNLDLAEQMYGDLSVI
jgi:hypothetical protein